jgi:hypothetical protein
MRNYYTVKGVIHMPNFDGTGLLKRGRIIGQGLGLCKKCNDDCEFQKNLAGIPVKEENAPV